jgi:predicted nucleic acid-binding protein
LKLLLDTNAYSALLRGHREVASTIRRADRVLLSAVVVGELLYGFRHGARFEENSARLEAFLEKPSVDLLPVGLTTAERFGRIAASLRQQGRPLPTNDVWIAAHAMETGADLLSSGAHFAAVEGLAWLPFDPADDDSVRERVRRYHSE